MQEIQVGLLGWEEPLEKEMATHSVFMPGNRKSKGIPEKHLLLFH